MFSFSIQTSTAVVIGTTCLKEGQRTLYKGTMYSCIKSGKKLVWAWGDFTKATPSPTPTVSVTATPSPTPTVSVTATPSPTLNPTSAASPSPSNPLQIALDAAAAERAAGLAAVVAADAKLKAIICIPDGDCPLGSTGPGGGTVFYDAGIKNKWGRYLEYAPIGWSGTEIDPKTGWCGGTNEYLTKKLGILSGDVGKEIGKGKTNTNMLILFCSSGAGNLAHSYRGGGKEDWFLPSKLELNELCKFALRQPARKITNICTGITKLTIKRGGFERIYWSSTEENQRYALSQSFVAATQPISSKGSAFQVRPIRSF